MTLTSLALASLWQVGGSALPLAILCLPIIGSILIGFSLGMFKKLALAQRQASYRFPSAFVFFTTFMMVLLAPSLKYPSLAFDMKELAIDDSNISYYDDRGLAIVGFFVAGLLFTFILFSITNALQHPAIRSESLNLITAVLPAILFITLSGGQLFQTLDTACLVLLSITYSFTLLVNALKVCQEKTHMDTNAPSCHP